MIGRPWETLKVSSAKTEIDETLEFELLNTPNCFEKFEALCILFIISLFYFEKFHSYLMFLHIGRQYTFIILYVMKSAKRNVELLVFY